MRRIVAVAAAGLLACGSATALPILVDPTTEGSDVSATITSSRCVGCFVDVSLSEGLDGEMAYLDAGDSFTFDFFEVVVGAFIGTAQVAVDATLAFTSPDISASGDGFGGFASLLFVINGGHLTWIQRNAIDLGDGTFLGVTFEDLFEFGVGNSTTVSATVTRYAAVPEPGTAALFCIGLLALWLATRRRSADSRLDLQAA